MPTIPIPDASFEVPPVDPGQLAAPYGFYADPAVQVYHPTADDMAGNVPEESLPDGQQVLGLVEGAFSNATIRLDAVLEPNTTYTLECDTGVPKTLGGGWVHVQFFCAGGVLFEAGIGHDGIGADDVGQVPAGIGVFTHQTLTRTTDGVGSSPLLGEQLGIRIIGEGLWLDNLKLSALARPVADPVRFTVAVRPPGLTAVRPEPGTHERARGTRILLTADNQHTGAGPFVFDRWDGPVESHHSRVTRLMVREPAPSQQSTGSSSRPNGT